MSQGKPIYAGKVMLGPCTKDQYTSPEVISGMNNYLTTMYTRQQSAASIESQESWYEKVRTDDDVHWGIFYEGELCGFTSIHIDNPNHRASTGILIFRKDMWGKGIASNSHIARTWYAATHLGVKIITTQVQSPNTASLKALLRVGYAHVGTLYSTDFRNGNYIHRPQLEWINPMYEKILFPEGTPAVFKQALKNAKKTLTKASKLVKYEE
jgi:RimJ/RimL family protein N-acetyltransferase